jgi:tetratricopeptide (TPR) repeat protein
MVTLRLTRGEDVTGRVTELDESHVCVDIGPRVVTIFEDILAGWEIHQPGSALSTQPSASKQEPAEPTDSQVQPATTELGPSPTGATPSLVSDPAVVAYQSRIEATYVEGVKRARLAAPEPDFSFSQEEFPQAVVADVRREWDRARNQYEYALKVREEARLVNIVRQVLLPIVERHPKCPSIHALTGCLLLKLGQRVEAVEHFRTAASTSRKREHWYALAYATTAPALECYALRNYLLATQTEDAREAWLRYLALAIDHCDLSGLARLLEHGFSQAPGSAMWRMASETLIYLYGRIGEQSAAHRATMALLHGQAFPPEGWRDVLRKVLPEPSPDLVHEEERDAIPAKRPRKPTSTSAPSGRIVSFGNQRFGFIDAEDGETYFFRLEDVADDGLRQALLDGSWRNRAQVEFTSTPSVGHRYQRAVEILPLQDVSALLNRAGRLRQMNQHSQAMALVRRALAAEPDSRDAQMLETNIKEEIRARGIGLPKDKGPYAHAKRAHLVDQDLVSAERLLRLAIRQGDKPESATKDLASLLQQQGRFNDAVAILESTRSSRRGVGPYDNMLATLYQHLGRHQDALGLLKGLEREANRRTRPPTLRRIAFSQFKSASYDEAERTLRVLLTEAPGDRTAERWLAGLEEARRIGSYDDAAEIIGGFGALAEEGFELSPLARVAIETCAFEGVDPSRLQTGTLTDKDVDRLEDLAKQLGTRRPRDRAAYYLSAAAILSRRASEEDAARIYDYLRRHFASMGDAAWVVKRPADVVRTYYLESLTLVSQRGDEAWRTLKRYLTTFSAATPEKLDELLPSVAPHGTRLEGILKSIRPEALETWRRGLLDASAQSSFFSQAIRDAIEGDAEARTSIAHLLGIDAATDASTLLSAWTTRFRELARSRSASYAVCATLTRHQLTAASMEDLLAQLKSLEPALSDLDRRRLGDLSEIAQSALGFCRAADFEEKEQHYWLVTTRAKTFVDQVQGDPTQFSHAALLPIAKHLSSLTEEEYAETARTSSAQLDLRLLVHDYPRLQHGVVKLQVEVANKLGCSPASSVRLLVGPEDSPYFESPRVQQDVSPALRGGASVVAQVALTLKRGPLERPAFPIVIRAAYRNRVGEESFTDPSEWTVRLYGESEFKEVPNRYAPYAEGGPVDDPEMFVGRGHLLDRLEASLSGASGSKCVVVFGQKRAGKSSLLEHLRRRLAARRNCVAIQFSLYEIGPALDEATFFYKILRGISDALEDRRDDGSWYSQFAPPTLEEMKTHPTVRFHEVMGTLIRGMRRAGDKEQHRLVLLIDEFTEVYKQIRKHIIPEGFMRAWKAVVEKRYFASVLVGQDIMPAFKASFANEFGVTEDIRVTYLSEGDARRLIEEPVGADRYAGNAVTRILGLTAGSPFYTMMLSSRLVDYMNRTRSAVVTEADIAAVEQEMISGDRRLTKDKFDNLICAGDGIEDSGIDPEDTLRLCAAIARGGERGWCSRESLRECEKERLDLVLTDLERRDVVERKGEALRLRVGLFRDWLLVQG